MIRETGRMRPRHRPELAPRCLIDSERTRRICSDYLVGGRRKVNQRHFASFNMTDRESKNCEANFQSCIDSARSGFILVTPGAVQVEKNRLPELSARYRTSICH